MLKFFPFSVNDYKPAELWLNSIAAQGFELQYIALFYIAKFKRTQTPSSYAALLWNQPNAWGSKKEFDEYADFLAVFGWEYVTDKAAMRIFRALPDTAKAPIMSDALSEVMQTHRRHWRGFKLGLLCVLVYIVIACLKIFFSDAPALLLARPLCILIFLMSVYIILQLAFRAFQYGRFKRAARKAEDLGDPLPFRSVDAARRAGTFYFIANLFYIAACLMLVIWDVSINASHMYMLPSISFAVSFPLLMHTIKNRRKKAIAAFPLKLGLCIALCAASLTLIFKSALREETEPVMPSNMPVLVLSSDETPVTSAYHTKTPLMSVYTYMGTLSDSVGLHHSIYVECISQSLAKTVFTQLAYEYNLLPNIFYFKYEPVFESRNIAFADEAIYATNEEVLVIRKGNRIMRAQHMGHGEIDLPRYIDNIRDIFAEYQGLLGDVN